MLPTWNAPAVAAERQLRLLRFDELEPEDWVARGVSPSVLRERVDGLSIYGGQAGIYCDMQRTRAIAFPGVAVSVLHTGRHYPDDVREDHIIYHYPRTKRRGHDVTEVNATKNAYELRLPVFVITEDGGRRDVFLSWVEAWDDALREFLITFASSGEPPVPFVDEPESEWVKFSNRSPARVEVERRFRDRRFALRVFQRYGTACAVCGLQVDRLIDAAHIIPVEVDGSHDPRNGLPLCPTHHRAFDLDAFVINPFTLELVTPGVDSLNDLQIPFDSIRHLPASPHDEALQWRWERIQ